MIEEFFQKENLPRFRKTQFEKAYYQEFISSFDDLTTWSKELREKLKKEVIFSSIKPVKETISADGSTKKILFERNDGKCFETVLIKHEDGRKTVCLSCMIGCPLGCLFCATGKLGWGGNLTAEEIVDQVLYFARILKKENQKVSNVVFMGMGEPLLNLENVLEAIEIFTNQEKMGLSYRRIAVSTAGITPQLEKLIAAGFKGRLVLSLHAANQELREKIMPVAKQYFLEELIFILKDYSFKNNKRINFEYIMIKKINDSAQDARDLAALIGRKLTYVNLIPLNSINGLNWERSKPETVKEFSKILTKCGVSNTIRVTMGDGISAACGQLAGEA